MFVFLIAGIWNTILALVNFGRLFNKLTTADAAEVLPTYVATAIACFAIFSLLLKIKKLEQTVDDLGKRVVTCDLAIKELKNSTKNK